MKHIEKKLVFHFYIGKNGVDTECNNLHFRCLELLAKNVFQKVLFVIVVDDAEKQANDIKYLQNKILGIFGSVNELEFKVAINTYLRDTETFYNEIVTKLEESKELILFAHNKGTTNLDKFEKIKIFKWVASMYFACLNNVPEVEYELTEGRSVFYGGLMNHILSKDAEGIDVINSQLGKERYLYEGTFFWINPQNLLTYLRNNNKAIPEINNRWYAENFPANTVPKILSATPNLAYALDCFGAHDQVLELIDISFHESLKPKLNEFFSLVIPDEKKSKIIEIVYIATNNYVNYLPDFLSTLKFFFPGTKKRLKIITDTDIDVSVINTDIISLDIIKTFDLFYPCINLHKTKFIESLDHGDSDYIFYFDADTRFIDNPDYDWGGLINSMEKGYFLMSLHPIYSIKDVNYRTAFLNNLFSNGITEKSENFEAYIPSDTYTYVISSFFCGKKETVLDVCSEINKMIMSDLNVGKGYHIPRFYDENYFNKLVYKVENGIDQHFCIRVDFFTCIEELENDSHPYLFLYQKGGNERFKSAKR